MKSSTKYTVTLNSEEMGMLRDLVRIGMRSKYYQEFISKDREDIDEEDYQLEMQLSVNQFINLSGPSAIGSLMDKYIFEGVQ